MDELTAKPVIKNKFWIVEKQGSKIATIQAIEDGGFAYVQNQERQKYPSIKMLSKEHNIVFDSTPRSRNTHPSAFEVYGFPVAQQPYNVLWDTKHQFAVYTKSKKSKSFFCAGHYQVKINQNWVHCFCPKLITLNRYQYLGPFKTLDAVSV